MSGDPHVRYRVIVQSSTGRLSETRDLLSQAGASVLSINATDGSIVADLTAEGIRWLARSPSTSRLSIDATVQAAQQNYTEGATLRTSMGLKKDGHLTQGSGSFTGEKIVVAVIDSGIEPSKDIDPQAYRWRSSISPAPAVSRP